MADLETKLSCVASRLKRTISGRQKSDPEITRADFRIWADCRLTALGSLKPESGRAGDAIDTVQIDFDRSGYRGAHDLAQQLHVPNQVIALAVRHAETNHDQLLRR